MRPEVMLSLAISMFPMTIRGQSTPSRMGGSLTIGW